MQTPPRVQIVRITGRSSCERRRSWPACLIKKQGNPLKPVAVLRWKLVGNLRHGEMHGGQELTRFVVNRVRDPFHGLFESLVHEA
jgi:hypothetical protein